MWAFAVEINLAPFRHDSDSPLKKEALRTKEYFHACFDSARRKRAIGYLQEMANPLLNAKEEIEIFRKSGEAVLDLNGRDLSTIPEEIRSIPDLQGINLSLNAITVWPDWFWKLTSLQILIVDGNNLTGIPAEIGNLTALEDLRFHGNQIAKIPDSIVNLQKLKRLGLSSNRLAKVSSGLSTIKTLEALYISGNPLLSLTEILAIKSLRELRMSGAGIVELPSDIEHLSNLRNLILKSNQLEGLPRGICKLSSIEILRLSKNLLAEIPKEIGHLTTLHQLDVSRNKLLKIPSEIGHLTQLRSLAIQGNLLSSLPPEIGNLKNLEELLASNNTLSSIPTELGELVNLSRLDLQTNQIATLPPSIGGLKNLTRLNISKNNLRTLPPEIGNISDLHKLTLEQNHFVSLPKELGRCRLKSVQLTSISDLRFPPTDVASLGGQAMLRYLRAADEGEEAVWESKLLLVGEGAVGKTWIFEALNGRLSGGMRTGATVGIEIGQLDIPKPGDTSSTMRLNCWDFAGQDFNHATHQFFFSERTLFVLCWNARAGWEAGKLRRWLTNIRDRAPSAKVILVATHIDQPHSDYPEKELRTEFPQIVSALKVSSVTGESIDALRRDISLTAESLPMMGLRWPKSWRAAQQAVQQLRAFGPYTSQKTVITSIVGAGIDPGDSSVLLRWLHELGEVLHYASVQELSDLVMLDPQWVTRHVGTVLASPRVQNANGILTNSDLDELWPDVDNHVRQHLLGMLDRFDLAYRIPDDAENRCLVVERLSQDPPEYENRWSQSDGQPEVRLCYRLKSMHPGIPTWFIARCHRFTLGLHWVRGVLFGDNRQSPRHMALITASEADRSITFCVRGPQPWSFLPLLTDGFEDTIRSRYPGLEFERKAPCPGKKRDGTQCGYEFDLRDLEALRWPIEPDIPAENEIRCVRCRTKHHIDSLLLGLSREPSRDGEKLDEILISVRTEGALTRQIVGENLTQMRKEQLDDINDLRKFIQLAFVQEWNTAQELEEQSCPTVFALYPVDGSTLIHKTRLRLQLYCMHPGCWHSIGEPGAYEFQPLRGQIVTGLKWLRRCVKWLKPAAMLLPSGSHLAGEYSENLHQFATAAENELKFTADLLKELKDLPEIDDDENSIFQWSTAGVDQRKNLELSQLREFLEAMRFPKTPFGGLSRLRTPEGHILWLCEAHAVNFQRTVVPDEQKD